MDEVPLIFIGDKGGAVMELLRVRRLFADEPVARFGMIEPGGRPHLTPVRFAVIDDGDEGVIVCTVDVEPTSLAAHARLRQLVGSPRVSFLADGDRDGAPGWWVQADAVAEVIRRGGRDPRFAMALRALADRYPDGGDRRHTSSIVWATVLTWNGWTAALDAAEAAA